VPRQVTQQRIQDVIVDLRHAIPMNSIAIIGQLRLWSAAAILLKWRSYK